MHKTLPGTARWIANRSWRYKQARLSLFLSFCFFTFTFPALCVVVGGLQLEVFDRNRRGRPWQNYDAAGSQRSNQTYRLDLTLITNKIYVKEILILQS